MYRRKSYEYYRASSEDKLLYVSGVPSRYWKATLQSIRFTSFTQEREFHKNPNVTISAKKQFAYFESILNRNALSESPVLGIGSLPTDDLAMAAATVLAKTAIGHNLRVEFIDLGNPPSAIVDEQMAVPDILVLHNITAESERVRFMQCRDWLRWGEDSFRIVVCAGLNPIDLFDNRIRFPLDASLYAEGQLVLNYKKI